MLLIHQHWYSTLPNNLLREDFSMRHTFGYLGILLIVLTMLTACAVPPPQKKMVTQAEPPPKPIFLRELAPAPIDPNVIRPGLGVTYYYKYLKRDIFYLQQMRKGEFRKKKGKPITEINHQFEDGNVFDSGKSRGVAMQMRGFLNFPETGAYSMQAHSNDGIILYINDKLAISDPGVHSDQLSNIAEITIDQPGWYPLAIDYFQRKGTAALKLYWKTPGDAEFAIVPAKAYGHLESTD